MDNGKGGKFNMQYKKGTIIAEPKVGSKKVLARMAPFVGATEVNFICGKCNTMLVKGFDPALYKDALFKCTNCGAINAP